MKILLPVMLCAVLLLPSAGYTADGEELPAVKFLDLVRRPPGRDCWARMSGKVAHMRRGQETQETTLSLGILFTPQRTLAQIVIGGSENYLVGQLFGIGSDKTSIIPGNKDGYKDPLLGRFGLRPEDLAMTFIFWDLIKELERDSVKGHDCRVFLLNAPPQPASLPETVNVYLSAKYFFPLKVEWFKDKETTPFRTLEVSSFRKENDFWLVNSMNLYGPGWRTRVEFDKSSAGQKDSAPRDLFLQQQ